MKKKVPIILAPMAGFTDGAFRMLCRRYGADETVTEMISAKAMTFKDEKTAALSALPKGDTPCAVQIFGHEADSMAWAARALAEGDFAGCVYEERPFGIDINMGCPVKKIVTSGDGSALMRDPALCAALTYAVAQALSHTDVCVSVKIRAGWDKDSKNAVDVAKACADAGAKRICVHARTREQMYAPGIDLDIIRAVREAVDPTVQVVGNGDISSAEDACKMLEYTNCDALMIGRAALGDPWIFNEIKAALSGVPFKKPDDAERIAVAKELVESIVGTRGEEIGIREARGRAAHFIKGMRGAARIREKLNRATTLDMFNAALCELSE